MLDQPKSSVSRQTTCPPASWARLSGIWNADAAGEGAESRKGPAPVCPQELFRHAVDGRTVANFSGGCALGRQQGSIAGLRLAPLVVGPGDVDPVPTSPLRGGDHGRMEFPGVLTGPTT